MKKSGRKKGKSIAARIFLGLFGILLIGYLGCAIFYIGHFLPGTVINEFDAAGRTESDIEKMIEEESGKYVLKVIGREETGGTISAKEIQLRPVFDSTIGELLDSQNAFAWPLGFLKPRHYTTDSVTTYDDLSLQTALKVTGIFDHERAPVDAALSEYTESGYHIVPEDEGTTLIRDKVLQAARSAVGSLAGELDLDAEGCYLEPEIRQDDPELLRKAEGLNRYVNVRLTIPYGNESEVLDGSIIGEWIKEENGEYSLDEASVKSYVDGLAKAHDTFGISRSFRKTGGETITVRGGNYGWWTDRPNTVKELLSAIREGKSGEFNPVYFSTAASYGENDIGSDYVEVNLDDQKVYVYKGGSRVVTSDCVSGRVSNGNMTPGGTYAITYKERNGTLVGEGYRSKVDYWMPFNGNIGLHDASWRNSFGGDIYLTNGSHGCVNLPPAKAKEIFANVEKGEAVVVYGGKQTAPKKEETQPELTPEQIQQLLLQQLLQQQAGQAGDASQAAAAPQPAEGAAQPAETPEAAPEAQ